MGSRIAAVCLLLAASMTARGEGVQFALTQGETQTVGMFGVTAAWAVDPTVADVTSQQSSVTVSGRSAGRTTMVVVSVTGEHSYDVIVQPRAGTTATQAKPRTELATAEVRYSSAAREIHSNVTVTRGEGARRTEASVRTVHRAGAAEAAGRPATSIAGASYRMFTPARELTLFDRDVDHSPLTLEATPLRGIHYRDEHWRLHAGYTAYATYRSFLIPVDRQLVAGGGYAFQTGLRSTLTPSLFAIRGEGTVASLLFDHVDPDRLFVRGEVAWSRGLAGAAQVDYDGAADRIRASARYRPRDFAVTGTASPRGFFGDASWSHRYGADSSFSTSWAATDALGMRVVNGAADVDHRVAAKLSLTGGASWATFDGRQTWNVPLGVRFDGERTGITALYRYTRAFNNEGGHGFRLAGRVSLGSFHASAFADHQKNAPTLELIFSERPDLALALAELGIVATSPGDVARALREQAILRELGFIDGVTIDLAPSRTQMGMEAAWIGTSRSRQQLRARVLRSVTESVASRTTTTIATLSYSRRLNEAMDVFASWSYWRTDNSEGAAHVQPFFEAGVRLTLDRFPSFVGGNGTISGIVFLDDDQDGLSDGSGITAAEVELDGTRRERTREDGTFSFKNVPRGTHRVVARVPERPTAYFTTPSRVEAEPGDRLAFGVASTPARLLGRALDDVGSGLGGVHILLTRAGMQLTAESGTDGRFEFASPPGEWQLSVVRDSIPAGYALATESRSVNLDLLQPVSVEILLQAHRSIRGRAAPHAEIDVQPLGRQVRADDEGRFSIRSLPPGVQTLASGGIARRIEIPNTPATMTVELVTSVPAEVVRTAARGEHTGNLGDHVVQIGAFRIHANAIAAAARAQAAGVPVVLTSSGTLTLVRTRPLQSRVEATSIAARLTHAGVDAVVLSATAL